MLILEIDSISCEITLRWMSQDFTDDKSTMVQVMAWGRRQKAITWANVDPNLCHHMVSLGHNGFLIVRRKSQLPWEGRIPSNL